MSYPNHRPSMALPIIPVNEEFAVAAQLSAAQVHDVNAMGFRALLNTRPDGEGGPDQPSHAEISAAAKALGLAYVFIPISPSTQTDADVVQMREALKTLPRPILGFCRSGNRVRRLYDLAQASS
jgi:uncharacterized protein (TIGR01244 family)